jgi:hypothetical protein
MPVMLSRAASAMVENDALSLMPVMLLCGASAIAESDV